MKTTFIEYLLNNGWKELNPMTFQNVADSKYELFFDTSNQIELYFKNERKDEKYILNQNELVEFLKKNNLTDLS
jgi:hypothetical protein